MSSSITFAPPPWVTALLIRPPPPPSTQPRTPPPPSAMRDLVAQWLVHVTDDTNITTKHAPHVIARFRGWLSFVFRIPTFVHRRETPPNKTQPLPTPQLSLIDRSLYFSSTINNNPSAPNSPLPPVPKGTKPKKKRTKNLNKETTPTQSFELSPLYKSLYFAAAEQQQQQLHQSLPPRCESPNVYGRSNTRCVHSFFLTDATGEGKGILDGLREMKAQSAEPQRKRGWVPAVVSIILIALNPLK